MSTGDRPACCDTDFHQLASRIFYSSHFICKARVKTDERMQIAVASVKNVRDAQLIACGDVVSGVEYLRQSRSRHNRILDHRVRRNTADRSKRAFACGPELLSLRFVARVATTARAILHADALNLFRLLVKTCFDSIQLDQQRRTSIRWQSRRKDTCLDRPNN